MNIPNIMVAWYTVLNKQIYLRRESILKRVISLLLAILTVVAIIAGAVSCGESSNNETPKESSKESNNNNNKESESKPYESDVTITYIDVEDNLPDNLDFGGEKITILSQDREGWTSDEVAVAAINSTPINDAIFKRNQTVSERINVKIEPIKRKTDSPSEVVRLAQTAAEAGRNDYQILVCPAVEVAHASVTDGGLFRNLVDRPYLDFEQVWWSAGYMDVMSCNPDEDNPTKEVLFSATGAISLSMYRFAFVTLFNKHLFDTYSVPYLYDTVIDGEWTMDYQYNLLETFHKSLGGDDEKGENQYGLVIGDSISVDPYWSACDIHLATKNSTTKRYEAAIDVNDVSNVVDKIARLFNSSGTYNVGASAGDYEQDDIRAKFAAGEAAMVTLRLLEVENDDLRNMKDAYGIVPMPMYDEDQADYYTYLHDQFSVWTILKNVSDDSMEMVCAFLEAMASESYRRVTPSYYNTALKIKLGTDQESWDMLDMIFKKVYMDAGILYYGPLNAPSYKFREIVSNTVKTGTNTTSSTYNQSFRRTFNRALDRLNTSLIAAADETQKS